MTLISELAGRLLRLPAPLTRDVVVERDLEVPMRDGAVLLADRYHPRGGERLPVVLVRSPYGRRRVYGLLYGRLLAERGLHVVVQSVRGTFGSGGRIDPFNEREDGLDTVEWLRARPWYAGRFGTAGPSYLGLTQWALAAEAGSELTAVTPSITAAEFRSFTYSGEAFTLETALTWTMGIHFQDRRFGTTRYLVALRRALPAALDHLPLRDADALVCGEHKPYFQEWLEHTEPGDPYWTPRDFTASVPEVTGAVSLVTGWHDMFLPATLRDYRALLDAGRRPQLTIGPWAHTSMGGLREIIRDTLLWQRAHLLGDRSSIRRSPVRFFVTGADEWRSAGEWPPPGATPRRWHLQPAAALEAAPATTSEPDHYRYDPASPTPAVPGGNLTKPAVPTDNRELEARPDVLTYTSSALDADLEAIGPVFAELHVRSSLEHTDFFVRVCDVDPSGRSINVCDALRRVRPGSPSREPDGGLVVTLELWPIAHRFRRGHRVRVQVSSGAHPRFARNPGSGEPLGTATTLHVAEQTVLHDPEHPSAIVLPVTG